MRSFAYVFKALTQTNTKHVILLKYIYSMNRRNVAAAVKVAAAAVEVKPIKVR